MFTKEAFIRKGISESEQNGQATFINNTCDSENQNANARLSSDIDSEGKQEAINSSGFTQKFRDKSQEKEEFKQNHPELFLQNHVNRSTNTIDQTDLSELLSSTVLDDFEPCKNITRNASGCNLKLNEEPEIDISCSMPMNEYNYGSSVFPSGTQEAMNSSGCMQKFHDKSQEKEEFKQNHHELFLQDHINRSCKNVIGQIDLSELLLSIDLDDFEPRKNITHNASGCDLKLDEESEIDFSLSKPLNEYNYDSSVFPSGTQGAINSSDFTQKFLARRDDFDILKYPRNIHQNDQFPFSNKSPPKTVDENPKKHFGANLTSKMLSWQERIPSHVVLERSMLSDCTPENELEVKNERGTSLTGKSYMCESSRLHKILEHVITEVEQTSFDEMSSAYAIVRILISYAEGKNF